MKAEGLSAAREGRPQHTSTCQVSACVTSFLFRRPNKSHGQGQSQCWRRAVLQSTLCPIPLIWFPYFCLMSLAKCIRHSILFWSSLWSSSSSVPWRGVHEGGCRVREEPSSNLREGTVYAGCGGAALQLNLRRRRMCLQYTGWRWPNFHPRTAVFHSKSAARPQVSLD